MRLLAVERANNFDTLRFCAAMAVLFSHAFPISQGKGASQPLSHFSHRQTDLGSIAVLVFFVISGYLITQSYDRSPYPWRFLKARILRIFPGLLLTLLLAAAVLGPAVTSLPFGDYFSDPATALYVPRNASLRWPQSGLPGVFADTPIPVLTNGSLWTLEYEFTMYLVVLALGFAGLLTRYLVIALWVVCAALCWKWLGGYYTHFALPFLSGAAIYLWRDRISLDWRLAAPCAVVVVTALTFGQFSIAFATCGAYLVIFLALATNVRMPNLARNGDLSYGIYIFAWPVQQTVADVLGKSVTWYWDVVLSIPIVLGLAWLSWHLVEAPALSLRHSGARAAAHRVPGRAW